MDPGASLVVLIFLMAATTYKISRIQISLSEVAFSERNKIRI